MRRDDGIPEEILPIIFKGGVERNDNHQPFIPLESVHPYTLERVLGLTFEDLQEMNLEEQRVLPSELLRALAEPYLSGAQSYEDMPIMVYQLWNMLDWREEHVTKDAARRFSRKLNEELGECLQEIRKVPAEVIRERWENPSARIEHETDSEVLSELGDVLFCATAGATMIGADAERGTAEELLDMYGRAVRFPKLGYLDQRVRDGIAERSELYPDGHMPYFVWSLANHETDVIFDEQPDFNLQFASIPIGLELEYLTEALDEAMEPLTKADMITGYGIPKRKQYQEIVGKLWVFTSYYAQLWGGGSITEAVKKNMEKISGRVAQGSLDDKGLRTDETL